MNNNDIEVLDDFEFESNNNLNNGGTETINNTSFDDNTNVSSVNKDEKYEETIFNNNIDNQNSINETSTHEEKEQLENPVVEMINNKTTLRLIGIMLAVLFVAVFLMPKFFELISRI